MCLFVTFLCTYTYKAVDLMYYCPTFSKIIFGIIAISLGFSCYIKAPLFVKMQNEETVDFSQWEKHISKNLGWLANISFALLTAEPSRFVSFFSNTKLTFFTKGRLSKFTWENAPVKPIHRFLDFVLLLVLMPIVYLFASDLFSFFLNGGLFVFIFLVFFRFRKVINYSFFSVNVGCEKGIKINVMYPYSTVRSRYKMYGFANQFNNEVFITEDTFRLNQIIKEYTIAHEMGHLKDRKKFIAYSIFSLIPLACVTILPFMLKGYLAFIPVVTYILYRCTFEYLINEKIELEADKYALKELGKERCLEALDLMSKNSTNCSTSRKNLFSFCVPLKRRIKFINEYKEKKD